VMAVGYDDDDRVSFAHRDGTDTTLISTDYYKQANALWGDGAGQLFAAGSGGLLLRADCP